MSEAALPGPAIARTLRAVSDSVLEDVARLAKLETSKRRLRPNDPRRVSVSEEIERLAERLLGASTEERALSEEALAASRRADGELSPVEESSIEATPPRPVPAILEAWRDAERRLARLDPDHPDARALELEIVRLRAEYRAAR